MNKVSGQNSAVQFLISTVLLDSDVFSFSLS
jgi:hypothetical protein